MTWRAYYADASTFGSDDGQPEEAPDGIQAVAEKRDGRTLLHTGGEFYRWDGRGWRARPAIPDVKRSGPLMDLAEFKALKERAFEWLSIPPS